MEDYKSIPKQWRAVFLISSYGTPLARPKSFLFGTAQFTLWASGTVNYDYIVANSINSSVNRLKMYSQWRTH